MATPLKLLLAEDNPVDAELLLRQLIADGFAPETIRVESESAYLAALQPGLDLIISDFDMPQFSGLRALELLQLSGLEVPFILVSGTIGEETAVEAMKRGAADYLLKDRLVRLGLAVSLAIEQHRLRAERRRAEEALIRSEEHVRQSAAEFQLLFEANPMPMWVFEHGTLRFLAVNDAAVQLYGYSREEFLEMTIAAIRPPEEVPRMLREIPGRSGEVKRFGLWRHRRKDGTPLDVEVSYRDMMFQGRDARLVLANDVTDRQIAERARQESESRFRQLAESIPQVFWLTDPDKNTILYVSPAYVSIWGRPIESLVADARAWLDAIHPDDRARVQRAMWLKQAAGTYDEEYRIVRPDGVVRTIHDRAFPVRNEQGAVVRIAGLATDITDRKELQEQFFRAQRLEAIGTLASGVAHDLNNILAPVLMAAGLLKTRATPGTDLKMLGLIENAAQRGAGIIAQLLAFSRGAEGPRGRLQLRHLLKELTHLMQETFPKNIAITLDAPKDLWVVVGEASQLHQVFMNLCVNARDAMPQGGELLITAANRRMEASPAGPGGSFIAVRVVDTGQGIPAEILSRIFDPFFTTKAAGKGTGLGLSTVLGLVKSHGGMVDVESTPGRGTTFTILLPAVESAGDQAVEVPVEPQSGRGQLLLVVDDEAAIVATLRLLLEARQYRVVTAREGQEAIRVFLEHRAAICAVVTDLMMPVMGGLDLARALRQLNPGLPVIACTGLDQEEFRRDCAAVGIATLLPKPFVPAQLFAAVEKALAASGTG
jgi:PAS domain S-box-containing protein